MKMEMTLQEVQQASLAVLKEIDRICLEHNFSYWIAYGTLIGAIRHGGFIPWDDDVDIVMPRKDYDAFAAYVQSAAYRNTGFELHSCLNNKDYPFYIMRFCDKSHELVFKGLNYKSGCFVDIYPYDGMGKEENLDFWKTSEAAIQQMQKKLVMSVSNGLLYGNSFAHKIGNIPQMILGKIRGKEYYYHLLDACCSKFPWDESTHVGIAGWSTGTYLYPKEWFDELIRYPFDSIEVNVPKEYDRYLRFCYGDYMQLPPEDKRVPYHEYTAYQEG